MKKNIIFISKIKKEFKCGTVQVTILHDITATFMNGHSYAITGVSGSGKSSLLHILAGFDAPTSGMVLFNNESIFAFTAYQKEQYLQKIIGFLFQQPYLIKELSVIENVMLPAQVAGNSYHDAYNRAEELLRVVGLISYAQYKPGVLSGGQQQRVALARSLCNKPLFLCADEPTASLDACNRDEIIALLQYGMREWGMGVIVCTHDAAVTRSMEQKFLLKDGLLHPL